MGLLVSKSSDPSFNTTKRGQWIDDDRSKATARTEDSSIRSRHPRSSTGFESSATYEDVIPKDSYQETREYIMGSGASSHRQHQHHHHHHRSNNAIPPRRSQSSGSMDSSSRNNNNNNEYYHYTHGGPSSMLLHRRDSDPGAPPRNNTTKSSAPVKCPPPTSRRRNLSEGGGGWDIYGSQGDEPSHRDNDYLVRIYNTRTWEMYFRITEAGRNRKVHPHSSTTTEEGRNATTTTTTTTTTTPHHYHATTTATAATTAAATSATGASIIMPHHHYYHPFLTMRNGETTSGWENLQHEPSEVVESEHAMVFLFDFD